MVSSESFYSGSSYALSPKYGGYSTTGYRMNTGEFSIGADPRVANQVKSVSERINTGLTHVEVQGLQPDVFESLPEQYLTELNRLAKLTGVKPSLHGPLVDAAGYSGKGGWDEEDRINAERQIKMAVQRGHKINPDGNIVITFHSSQSEVPGTEFQVVKDEHGDKVVKEIKAYAINRETGQPTVLKLEPRYYPEDLAEFNPGDKVIIPPETVEKELSITNRSDWHQNLTQVLFYKNRGDEMLEKYYPVIKSKWPTYIKALTHPDKLTNQEKVVINSLTNAEKSALGQSMNSYEYIQNSQLVLNGLFNKAYKFAENEEDKKKLIIMAKEYSENFKTPDLSLQSAALQELIGRLETIQPKLYMPLEEFRREKASQTFGSVAFDAYKDYGSNAPIISIENPPAGTGLSTGEELKKLVEKSREEFVKKAVKDGISKSTAEDAAEKLIGATWDVGHINMLRRYGYEKEHLLDETEKIAPFVKHVHLSDNFGFEHTELPMGMGNVPIKEIMEKLGKEGFEGDKVIEARNWWQHFSEQGKITPVAATLEAFGSPLYPMAMAPYWNQMVGTFGGYSAGFGQTLPDQHFSMYGAGFESLPLELGGQVPGKQSRFSGAPMD